MADVKPPTPEPFHPPVGVSDEAYARSARWLMLTLALAAVLVAGVVVLLGRA